MTDKPKIKFHPTGIEDLDKFIFMQLDTLLHYPGDKEKQDRLEAELQGVRATLVRMDKDQYEQTVIDIATNMVAISEYHD